MLEKTLNEITSVTDFNTYAESISDIYVIVSNKTLAVTVFDAGTLILLTNQAENAECFNLVLKATFVAKKYLSPC